MNKNATKVIKYSLSFILAAVKHLVVVITVKVKDQETLLKEVLKVVKCQLTEDCLN